MKVSSIVIPVKPLFLNDTIGAALSLMHSGNVDILPVSDPQKGLVGAVTRSDLLSALQNGMPMTGALGDCLSEPPARLKPDELIEEIPGSAIPALVRDDTGAVVGVVTLEGYAAALQGAIREFREQISSIMDSAENGIIAINESGTIVTANRKAMDLFGVRADEFIGRNILEAIPNTRLMDIMKSGKPLAGQKFEGQNVSLMVNYAPVIRDGKVVGAVSVFQDISLLEEISNELGVVKGLNRELGAIIHSSYDGIWITDGEGLVLDINEAYERITGIQASEVIGRTMQDLVKDGYFDQSVTLVVMKELKSVTLNQTVKGKKQILVTGNPIFDENGKLFRVVTNVRDVTELANLQEQLSLEKEQVLKYKTELTHLRSMQIRDEELIFRSGLMMQVVDLAVKMADVDSTLLIRVNRVRAKKSSPSSSTGREKGTRAPSSASTAPPSRNSSSSRNFSATKGAPYRGQEGRKAGPLRTGEQGDAFPRRSGRTAARPPGKDPAGHPGQADHAGGGDRLHARQRQDNRRHEPESGQDAQGRHLPRRPLLPPHGCSHPGAAPAEPQGRHPSSGPVFPGRIQRAFRIQQGHFASGP